MLETSFLSCNTAGEEKDLEEGGKLRLWGTSISTHIFSLRLGTPFSALCEKISKNMRKVNVTGFKLSAKP